VIRGLLSKRDRSYPKFEKYPGSEICRWMVLADGGRSLGS
jgi:hypothetical protein